MKKVLLIALIVLIIGTKVFADDVLVQNKTLNFKEAIIDFVSFIKLDKTIQNYTKDKK